MDSPDGRNCGDCRNERVERGKGGGGFAGVTGNVTGEFNVEAKTSCVVESGRDSPTGAVFPVCSGDSAGRKRTKGSVATKYGDGGARSQDIGKGAPTESFT